MLSNVSVVVINHILNILSRKYDLSIELEEIGLNGAILKDEKARIEISKLKELFALALQKSRDENLALNIGFSVNINVFGVLGYIMSNSKNLKNALLNLEKYHFLIGKMLTPKLTILDNSFKLSIESSNQNVIRYKNELHLSAIFKLLKDITKRDLTAKYVYFSHSKPKNIERYREIFTDRIYFDKDENAIIFDKNLLEVEIEDSNPTLLSLFIKEAEKQKINFLNISFSMVVYKTILESFDREIPSIKHIASTLNCSTRTLQERLKSENESFQNLLLKAKKELSIYYLNLENIPITQIAIILGYAESSSFNRAFKSWFNISPSEYKREFNLGQQNKRVDKV